MNLADEMLDHFLRDLEIGDDTVTQRAAGRDVPGGAAEHLLRFFADRDHVLLATSFGDRDDTGLGENDATALHVNKRVGGAEIDRHVSGHDRAPVKTYMKPSRMTKVGRRKGGA